MNIGALHSPGTALFQLSLLDNGKPYASPAATDYRFTPSFTSPDPTIEIEADQTTAALFHVEIPAGLKSTAVVLNAEAEAPDGTLILAQAPDPVVGATPAHVKGAYTASHPAADTLTVGVNTVSIPIRAVAQRYSIEIKQVA